jgi:hypothetical protein
MGAERSGKERRTAPEIRRKRAIFALQQSKQQRPVGGTAAQWADPRCTATAIPADRKGAG